jgi:hypothetical protein
MLEGANPKPNRNPAATRTSFGQRKACLAGLLPRQSELGSRFLFPTLVHAVVGGHAPAGISLQRPVSNRVALQLRWRGQPEWLTVHLGAQSVFASASWPISKQE